MDNSSVIKLDESNFDRELKQDDKPVIVDFWASWCGPCKMIAPLLDEIAKESDGRFRIAKVNVEDDPALMQRFGVRAVPTLLFFSGGKQRDQIVGAASKKAILAKFEALAGPSTSSSSVP